ncbi:hypothetical protein SLEP1_g58979 [Rubroshorea leprosula]|uniref:Transcription factor MYC/MYB N-terminal domain-containing protein n=1 Tax=Rubroshorea leprosula TaxID=152421 RepID=A0AAV5MTG8_9ROSI|nr:hypothetical protein SLEP1_g58979 [Rubroshorea leprosula]
MGTTALRQLLKSLCSNSPWKYAVLWKLRHWSPLILTWEDGYCVYPGPREPLPDLTEVTVPVLGTKSGFSPVKFPVGSRTCTPPPPLYIPPFSPLLFHFHPLPPRKPSCFLSFSRKLLAEKL